MVSVTAITVVWYVTLTMSCNTTGKSDEPKGNSKEGWSGRIHREPKRKRYKTKSASTHWGTTICTFLALSDACWLVLVGPVYSPVPPTTYRLLEQSLDNFEKTVVCVLEVVVRYSFAVTNWAPSSHPAARAGGRKTEQNRSVSRRVAISLTYPPESIQLCIRYMFLKKISKTIQAKQHTRTEAFTKVRVTHVFCLPPP